MAAPEITIAQLLTWIGLDSDVKRDGVTNDMMDEPEGLGHLIHESSQKIVHACSAFTKRFPTDTRFSVTRIQERRLISLMHWTQDKYRCHEEFIFPVGTNRESFLKELDEAGLRHIARLKMETAGKDLMSKSFTVKLLSRKEYERWSQELFDTCSSIIGAAGIPLSYVIRENEDPILEGHPDWETKVIAAAPLSGSVFKIDTATVHNLILNNIGAESDAYIWIKPHLNQRNGRLDLAGLKAQYGGNDTNEIIGNTAKQVFAKLYYKEERIMAYEVFTTKFTNSVNDMERASRGMTELDIVDAIWEKIQHPGLTNYCMALKAQQIGHPLSWQDILQRIASEAAKLSSRSFKGRNISAVGQPKGTNRYTHRGECPQNGVHTKEGLIYTGNYPNDLWHHQAVRPFHQEILKYRNGSGGGNSSSRSTNSNYSRSSKVKRQMSQVKSRLASVTAQVKDLEIRKRIISSIVVDESDTASGMTEPTGLHSQAGTAFGGKNTKRAKKT